MFVEIKTESSFIRIPFETLSIHLPKAAQVSLLSNENETIVSTIPIITHSTLLASAIEPAQTNLTTSNLAELRTSTPEKSPEDVQEKSTQQTENDSEKSITESAVTTIDQSQGESLAPGNDESADDSDSEPETELDIDIEDSQAKEDGKAKVLTEKQQERLRLQKLRLEEKERKRLEKEEQKKQRQAAIAEKKEANAAKKKELEDKKAKEDEELKQYADAIKVLNDLGHKNNKQNIKLLKLHNGNVEQVKASFKAKGNKPN